MSRYQVCKSLLKPNKWMIKDNETGDYLHHPQDQKQIEYYNLLDAYGVCEALNRDN